MRKLNYERVHKHLVNRIKSYFKNTNITKCIVGVSGGIDSALVAKLAVDALGDENVVLITMPSHVTGEASLERVELLHKFLGISILLRPINNLYSTVRDYAHTISENIPGDSTVFHNIQARARGVMLMTAANILNAIVLGTGNKSENMVGYCTLYGDTVGAFEPIGDLYKTEVWELAKYLNLPAEIISAIPSAELAEGQTDEKDLLPYADLDTLLYDHFERHRSIKSVAKKLGWYIEGLERIVKMHYDTAFKRKQTAPTLKLSTSCIIKT